LDEEGVAFDAGDLPLRASEDFGRFGAIAPAAMFFLGAGDNHASLHNPDYDFPDDLIGIGAGIFMRTLRNLLG
jgi:metal-dependent amidase/aminoacylase/carboxypeptidase family protein